MASLFINTDNTQPVTIMQVKGRVDSETAPELESALTNLLTNNRNKIILNLQAVNYLSSAGLRALVKALKQAQNSGGDLRLASVSEPIEVVLRTVGMMQMFKLYSSEQEAVTGF
jgi:anti-sigma B factor antagonist